MIQVRCYRPPWTKDIDFAVFSTERPFAVAEPLTMRDRKQGETIVPTFTLENMAAQQLIDALWSCGLRPSEGTGSAGSLAATQQHLADMQKIAFGALKKEGIL
jgi:hypothetical protein